MNKLKVHQEVATLEEAAEAAEEDAVVEEHTEVEADQLGLTGRLQVTEVAMRVLMISRSPSPKDPIDLPTQSAAENLTRPIQMVVNHMRSRLDPIESLENSMASQGIPITTMESQTANPMANPARVPGQKTILQVCRTTSRLKKTPN